MSESLSYDIDTSFSKLSPSLPTSLPVETTKRVVLKKHICNYLDLPSVSRLSNNSSLEPHHPKPNRMDECIPSTLWLSGDVQGGLCDWLVRRREESFKSCSVVDQLGVIVLSLHAGGIGSASRSTLVCHCVAKGHRVAERGYLGS